MHDVVSHNLQVMVTLADAAAAAQATDPGRATEALHEVSSTGRQALTDMRRMLGVLATRSRRRANDAAGDGRPPLSPQPGLGDLDALVDRVRATGLDVTLECGGRPFPVSGAAGLTVYRIVQEALTNTLKHAHEPTSVAGAARVQRSRHFGAGDRRRAHGPAPVTVPGLGNGPLRGPGSRSATDARQRGAGAGAAVADGLAGMMERAAVFGGTLVAGPRPDGGWEVTAMLRDCTAPITP